MSKQELEDIRLAKQWMETQIRDAVILASTEFYQKTGFQVTGFTVDVIDIRTQSDQSTRSAIGRVTARVEL